MEPAGRVHACLFGSVWSHGCLRGLDVEISDTAGPKSDLRNPCRCCDADDSVVGACAAAGLVIGGITMGLASKFSYLVFAIAGDNLYLSVCVAAAVTLLLGLGMPTPSAYILAAVLISPVLYDLGLPTLPSQLFCSILP